MILKFLFAAFMIYLTLALFKKNKSVSNGNEKKDEAVDLVKDPVCDTYVEKDTDYKVKLYDRIYYFCSEECRQKFIEQKKNKGEEK